MHNTTEQKYLLRKITNYIRQKLELQVILTAVAADLRSFIKIDRVKICKFNPDGSGHIIAESVNDNRLPSMLGLHFPGDEIPAEIRELYLKVGVRSIVNVNTKEIGQSALYHWETAEVIQDEIHYRPVDPCHLEYLTAIGVTSSLVLPILYDDQLWGLLACHHSEPRSISTLDMELVQMVVEQISVAIAQSTLFSQIPEQTSQETSIKQIVTLLHSLSIVEFQSALAQAVTTFDGSGGRLYIKRQGFTTQDNAFENSSYASSSQSSSNNFKVYTYGKQPVMPKLAKYQLMEQYSVWQQHYKFSEYAVWAIPDIYQIHELRFLQVAFQGTKVRNLLMIPLHHRQQLLGYLSIFRDEMETESFWAGEFSSDSRVLYSRQSLNIWRESNKTAANEWSTKEIQLADKLGKQFSFAVYEEQLQQQLDKKNDNLLRSIQKQQRLVRALTKMRQNPWVE